MGAVLARALTGGLLLVLCWAPTASAAISCTNLASAATGVDNTSFATSSVTLTANVLSLLSMTIDKATTPDEPTSVTSTGATWVKITTETCCTVASPTERTSLYRTMVGSNQTGAITIDFGANTETGFTYSVDQCTGTDTTGTDGSGAIVQSGVNASDSVTSGAPLVISLSALSNASNALYGAFSRNANATITPGLSTELVDLGHANPAARLETQWQIGAGTVSGAPASGTVNMGGIGIEIAVPAAAGATPQRTLMGVGT